MQSENISNLNEKVKEEKCDLLVERYDFGNSYTSKLYGPFLNLFLKLFEQFDSIFKKYFRIRKRLKNITSLEFIIIFVFVIFSIDHIRKMYFLYEPVGKEPKDTMDMIFREHNLLRRKISCGESVNMDQMDRQFSILKSEKYKLFDQFYKLKISNKKNDINIFDMKYNDLITPNDPPSLFEFLNKLKFCTIKEYRVNFDAKSIYKDSQLNFKNLLFNRSAIQDEKFKFINPNNNLKQGGYYKPPLCIQEYLYYHTSDENLLKLKSILDTFRLGSNQNIHHLIKNLSKFSYEIIKEHFNSEILQNKISKFVRSKENDLTVIVIPLMNRENNLLDLMYNLHPFLQKQFLYYKILVVEQSNSNDSFNKGRLYNSAFDYLLKNYRVQDLNDEYASSKSKNDDMKNLNVNCIIMHDVDLIPESDFNIYGCGDDFVANYNDDMPRHLSLSIRSENEKEFNYTRNLYELLIGGVLCLRPKNFYQVNGFSNEYWNWGAEDDDLAYRIVARGVCITRPRDSYALYKMSQHKESKRNSVRTQLLSSSLNRMHKDGLSNLASLKLPAIIEDYLSIYTRIKVFVDKQPLDYFKNFNNTVDYLN